MKEDKFPTLEEIERIVLQFADRTPARIVAIKVHPDYLDVFNASLREEGVITVKHPTPAFAAAATFRDIPIYTDADVPYRQIKCIYAGDQPGP